MSSDDEFDLGGLLADIGARRLGFDVIRHGETGETALMPRTVSSLDEWEARSLAMHREQARNMLRVADVEEDGEDAGEAVDRLTVTRI